MFIHIYSFYKSHVIKFHCGCRRLHSWSSSAASAPPIPKQTGKGSVLLWEALQTFHTAHVLQPHLIAEYGLNSWRKQRGGCVCKTGSLLCASGEEKQIHSFLLSFLPSLSLSLPSFFCKLIISICSY